MRPFATDVALCVVCACLFMLEKWVSCTNWLNLSRCRFVADVCGSYDSCGIVWFPLVLRMFVNACWSHCCMWRVHHLTYWFLAVRRYASAVFAVVACTCVCSSVTSRCYTKPTKRRITQTTLRDSSGTLLLWCKEVSTNSDGITRNWDAKCRWRTFR